MRKEYRLIKHAMLKALIAEINTEVKASAKQVLKAIKKIQKERTTAHVTQNDEIENV